MGGTSCDVCVVEDGEVRRTDSRRIGGRTIQLPMVDVHTVGAGGGSIGWRDAGGALRVGPRSAGAEPGPACYGRGGERADGHRRQPPARPPRRRLAPGRRRRARRRGGRARRSAASPATLGLDRLETAAGIVRVANQEMVRALRVVTVERGVDPRGFALLPFGGAGPMHAAAIAAELGIETILCPRASGVLSALGLCASERRRDTARTVMLSGAGAQRRAHRRRGRRADRRHRRRTSRAATPELVYEMRYAGQAFELPVPGPGRSRPRRPASSASSGPRGALRPPRPRGRGGPRRHPPGDGRRPARSRAPPRPRAGELERGDPRRSASAASGSRRRSCAASPAPATAAEGPVVFELPEATLVLPPGWRRRGRRGRHDRRAVRGRPGAGGGTAR